MDDSIRQYQPSEYWQERLSKDFSLGGVGMLGLGPVFNGWLYKLRRLAVNRAVRVMRIGVEGRSVLDVGCGTGFWLQFWQRKGATEIWGIDIAQVSIDNLRQQYPGMTLCHDDIARPGLELGKKFDLISAFDVLYHITNDETWALALSNIARHLKPGGWLLLTDLFLHEGEYRIYHQLSRPLSEYEYHLSRLGMRILARLPIFVIAHYPHDARAITRRMIELIWELQTKSLAVANRVGLGSLWGHLLGSFIFLADAIFTYAERGLHWS